MIYFRYKLNKNNEGPDKVLPSGSITGIYSNGNYYGSSNIINLNILSDWQAEEITETQYNLETTPVPESITRRQCAIEMRERGMITPQEALDMTKYGKVPAIVNDLFLQMSVDDRIKAETDFAATNYLINNPLLLFVMSGSGSTKDEIDQFFRDASKR